MDIDRRRIEGRFLLTGSSHVLLLPKLADSLAGRLQLLRLHPLSQSELGSEPPRFLDALFSGAFGTWQTERLAHELAERVAAGGYPPALKRGRDVGGQTGTAITRTPSFSATYAIWRAFPRWTPSAGS